MIRQRVFRQLAAAVLLFSGTASALPNEGPAARRAVERGVQQPSPSAWVSIDSTGKAHTFLPTVTSINGAATTISPPPDYLTKFGTYTLTPTGVPVTTLTGVQPVQTALDSSGAGVFLACNIYQGEVAPFCAPRSGSQLNPGKTYYSESPSFHPCVGTRRGSPGPSLKIDFG
jgi:hypothetical protein